MTSPVPTIEPVTATTPYESLPEQLTVAEYIAYTRTSKWSAYDLIRRGELPAKRYGRVVRIPKSAVNSFHA
jgi:excisionase family DNA binding protein